MGLLYEQLEKVLLPGMIIPEPLQMLYKWIEDNILASVPTLSEAG